MSDQSCLTCQETALSHLLLTRRFWRKTTGREKTHFVVVLACMADGYRLKAFIIFKRKTLPKFPPCVIDQAHVKGWMDVEGVQEWWKRMFNIRSGALLWKREMLVWDQSNPTSWMQ